MRRYFGLALVLTASLAADQPTTTFGQPAVSTSFADADPTIHLSDDFSPASFRPLGDQRIAPDGGFLLSPGGYSATVKSFCLHAGTYAPSKGEGYLYAPLKGARAGMLRTLLRAVPDHPAIPQTDVQTLIWAIEADMAVIDLAPPVQEAAELLLSAQDIALLNVNRVRAYVDTAIARLPPQVRDVMEWQGTLRNLIANPQSRFAEIERLAVKTGIPPRDGPDIPRGRWSSHPSGAFVRYLPEGYSTTVLEIYVEPQAGPRNEPLRSIPVAMSRCPRTVRDSGWESAAWDVDLRLHHGCYGSTSQILLTIHHRSLTLSRWK